MLLTALLTSQILKQNQLAISEWDFEIPTLSSTLTPNYQAPIRNLAEMAPGVELYR
jgi:hypothetical protein